MTCLSGANSSTSARFGTQDGSASRDGERGDTLIEILVALTIVGLAAVALISAFLVSFSGAATYRKVTTLEFTLKSFAETATYQIQQAPLASSTAPAQEIYSPCASVGVSSDGSTIYYGPTNSPLTILFTLPPGGYVWVGAQIAFWQGPGTSQGSPAFGSSCSADQLAAAGPQLITVSLKGPTGASDQLSFVVTDPNYTGSLVN